MIYLDSSVVLAHLLAEDRRPRAELWAQSLISSRLLEYEVWARIQARGLAATHSEEVHAVTGRVAFLELIPEVVGRVREPMPPGVRTLDALHLACLAFLRAEGQDVQLASYDERMRAAAGKLGFRIYPL
ncbi:MAG: PIN domain-containing protein [Gemmatimonadetes bacterium]|nr:PIN domain-containing protein [Gemmatimonadota bacterium]